MGKSKGIEDTRELSLSDEQFSGAFRGGCLEASTVKNGNAVGKEKHSEKLREYHHKPGSVSGKEKNSTNFGKHCYISTKILPLNSHISFLMGPVNFLRVHT